MNIKKYFFITGSLGSCIAVIAVIIISFYRGYCFNELYKDKVIPFNSEYSDQWLKAVEKNDPLSAIKLSEKIVPVQFPYLPDTSYLTVAELAGINSTFFNPPFNKIDFIYWRDMYLMKKFLNKIKNSNKNIGLIKKIFDAVNQRIKIIKYEKEDDRPAFISQIWSKKEGDIIDKYLLFSSLAEQAGYLTQIGVVYEEKLKNPLYVLAMTVKNGVFFTVDFKSGNVWEKPIGKLLTENKDHFRRLCGEKWSDENKIIIYKLEASAMSYRKSNQLLGSFMQQSDNPEIPIIGRDPIMSQKRFHDFLKNEDNSVFALGLETFLMLKNYKDFPKQWKIHRNFVKNN